MECQKCENDEFVMTATITEVEVEFEIEVDEEKESIDVVGYNMDLEECHVVEPTISIKCKECGCKWERLNTKYINYKL